jgi:hypothetical protein
MSKQALVYTQPPTQWVPQHFNWGAGHHLKQTMNIHLMPRLRMCEALPQLLHLSFHQAVFLTGEQAILHKKVAQMKV